MYKIAPVLLFEHISSLYSLARFTIPEIIDNADFGGKWYMIEENLGSVLDSATQKSINLANI
jgi:hypothetical protein